MTSRVLTSRLPQAWVCSCEAAPEVRVAPELTGAGGQVWHGPRACSRPVLGSARRSSARLWGCHFLGLSVLSFMRIKMSLLEGWRDPPR